MKQRHFVERGAGQNRFVDRSLNANRCRLSPSHMPLTKTQHDTNVRMLSHLVSLCGAMGTCTGCGHPAPTCRPLALNPTELDMVKKEHTTPVGVLTCSCSAKCPPGSQTYILSQQAADPSPSPSPRKTSRKGWGRHAKAQASKQAMLP